MIDTHTTHFLVFLLSPANYRNIKPCLHSDRHTYNALSGVSLVPCNSFVLLTSMIEKDPAETRQDNFLSHQLWPVDSPCWRYHSAMQYQTQMPATGYAIPQVPRPRMSPHIWCIVENTSWLCDDVYGLGVTKIVGIRPCEIRRFSTREDHTSKLTE